MANEDLTLIAELGRSKRDVMIGSVPTVRALADGDPTGHFRGSKTEFAGIGQESLLKFHARAKLLTTPGAAVVLKAPVRLAVAPNEVYFDIESDPMRDVVYLHGFVERVYGEPATATYVHFFSNGVEPAQEETAFREAWYYLSAKLADSVVYYYSKFERTAYKRLAEKYPAVCSVEDVEALFGLPSMVDIYTDVVRAATEWPTHDQSLKTLAQHLGYNWRDTHPSGAASIEWFHRWTESRDRETKQRILDYNEDDCAATGVVVDHIRSL